MEIQTKDLEQSTQLKRYIVGLCGTHGTGKSTLLQNAKSAGYRVNEAQLSRRAQNMLGWESLGPAKESEENMWLLQDMALRLLEYRDNEIFDFGQITLVERTPADLFAYTKLWMKINGVQDSQRSDSYFMRCKSLATRYLKFILVPPLEKVPFEDDPHRATLDERAYHQGALDTFFWDNVCPMYVIKNQSKSEREAEILALMKALNT